MDQRAIKLRDNLMPSVRHIASTFGRTAEDVLLYIKYKIEDDIFWFDYPSESPQEMTFQNELSAALTKASVGTGLKGALLDTPENRLLMEK